MLEILINRQLSATNFVARVDVIVDWSPLEKVQQFESESKSPLEPSVSIFGS
jgi:hypothetical protein